MKLIAVALLLLNLSASAAQGPCCKKCCCHCSGGGSTPTTPIKVTNNSVLGAVLNSAELNQYLQSNESLKRTDFRSVTVERQTENGRLTFLLSLEYEALERALNCTFEARVEIGATETTVTKYPAPKFAELDCSERN